MVTSRSACCVSHVSPSQSIPLPFHFRAFFGRVFGNIISSRRKQFQIALLVSARPLEHRVVFWITVLRALLGCKKERSRRSEGKNSNKKKNCYCAKVEKIKGLKHQKSGEN